MEVGPDEITRRIEALRADRTSGASELLSEAIAVLSAAEAARTSVTDVARAICQAQPTMAAIWNAAIAAVASAQDADRFPQFVERVRRAPAALARFATAHFSTEFQVPPASAKQRSGKGGHLVTISFSSSVLGVLKAIHGDNPIQVACSESRPALEGHRLAAQLAAAGIPVTFFTDAGIGHALADADAVVVGADAIGPTWFLNKTGTRLLAAAAAFQGIPLYVIATRDKFVGEALGAELVIRYGRPDEIWDAPPPGVEVRNPYFESTPLDLVTAVISDIGVLGSGMVPDVCQSIHDATALQALHELTAPNHP